MEQPRKPFTLYTYYLIAVIATLIGSAFLAGVVSPNMNDYIFFAMFPTIFIGILLIGYFKWRRYRKIMRLTGKETIQYGLGSTPIGLAVGTAKDLASNSKVQITKGDLPKWAVFIILSLVFILFEFVVYYFGAQ